MGVASARAAPAPCSSTASRCRAACRTPGRSSSNRGRSIVDFVGRRARAAVPRSPHPRHRRRPMRNFVRCTSIARSPRGERPYSWHPLRSCPCNDPRGNRMRLPTRSLLIAAIALAGACEPPVATPPAPPPTSVALFDPLATPAVVPTPNDFAFIGGDARTSTRPIRRASRRRKRRSTCTCAASTASPPRRRPRAPSRPRSIRRRRR